MMHKFFAETQRPVGRRCAVSLRVTTLLFFAVCIIGCEGKTVAPTPTPFAPVSTDVLTATTLSASTTPTLLPTPMLTPTVTPISLIVPTEVNQISVPEQADANLEALWAADFPSYDYLDVARSFGDDPGPRTITTTTPTIGETRTFIVEGEKTRATLAIETVNAWFWMEEGLEYDSAVLQEVADNLETKYYPTLTRLFGTEWRPGVDGDPHFSLLHFKGPDELEDLGFFDSVHEYPDPPGETRPTSNAQEMVFLNMNMLDLNSDLYNGTLVHEMQHMIQWHNDANETVWLDEGLGQLAEIVNGLDTARTDNYLEDTTVSLTGWDYDEEFIYQHYSATFLFLTYVWEQLGDEAVRALATDSMNGISSVRKIVAQYAPDRSLEQFLADWAAANQLAESVLTPRYTYQSLYLTMPEPQETIRDIPYGVIDSVAQYGVHYIDIGVPGTYTLTFAGDTTQSILPVSPKEGETMWVSPSDDNIRATLSRSLDLRGLDSATLDFSIWFDTEYDYDYGYVLISDNDGRSWTPLPLTHYTPSNWGDAFTGRSIDADTDGDGWVDESILLDDWVGKEVIIRFELLTDWQNSDLGMAIDHIRVPQLDLDWTDSAGWDAAGFVNMGQTLPQQWSLQLLNNGETIPIELDAWNRVNLAIDIPPNGLTLIVMPQTPFVRDDATYWLELDS